MRSSMIAELKKYIESINFFKKLPQDIKNDLFIVGGIFPAIANDKPINDIDLVVRDVKGFQNKLKTIFKREFHLIEDNRGNRVMKFIFNKTRFDITELLENFKKDARRRDFTINSVVYSFKEDRVIDHLNGINDIKNKILRMCSTDFLKLDPIRFLRYYRMKLYYKLKVEPETKSVIKGFSIKYLLAMPKERIYYELKKIFGINGSFKTIEELERKNVISSIILPLQLMNRNTKQNKFHSFDVYKHSFFVYKWIEYYEKKYGYYNNSFILKLAGLLHDIGKESTRTRDNKGEYHFYGHEKKGVTITEQFLKSEPLSKNEKTLLLSLIKNHMYLAYLKFNKSITPRSLRKFLEFANAHIMEHIILFLSDGAAAHDKVDADQERFVVEFLTKLEEFKRMINKNKKKIVSGSDLINLGFKSNKLLGVVLKEINDLYYEGKIKNKKEALDYARKNLKNS